MDEARAVFQVAVVAQDETGGHHGVEDAAAVAGDAVHEDDALTDLRRFLLGGVDGDVLQLARALDVAVRADFRVLEDPAVLDDAALADGAVVAAVDIDAGLGDLLEALLQLGVVGVFGPEVGVGRGHPVEGHDLAASDLVHHFEPDAHILGFALLDGAVAELGVVGGGDLLNVEEDAAVADDAVGHIVDVVDGHVVADVAGDDAAVGDADRHAQVVVLEHVSGDASDAHHPEEVVVAHHRGVELVGDPDVVPVGGGVVVEDEAFDFVGAEVPPPAFGFLHLLVAVVVFVVTVMQILRVYEILVDPVVG